MAFQAPALRGLAVSGTTFAVVGGATLLVSRVVVRVTRFTLKQYMVNHTLSNPTVVCKLELGVVPSQRKYTVACPVCLSSKSLPCQICNGIYSCSFAVIPTKARFAVVCCDLQLYLQGRGCLLGHHVQIRRFSVTAHAQLVKPPATSDA